MITVRFPSGFSVQYKSVSFVKRSQSYSDLYEKEGGRWIAQVPNAALIELVSPCRTYNEYNAAHNTAEAIDVQLIALECEIASLKQALKKKGTPQ